MATFSGSFYADTITPDAVSSRVVREPGSKPSAAADRIDGFGANDILDGGGGADIIKRRCGSTRRPTADTVPPAAAGRGRPSADGVEVG